MLKPGPGARHGKGGPRTRIKEKVVAGIATLSLVASMCPGTAALAYANGQYAAGSADLEAQAEPQELVLTAQDEPVEAKAMTKDTHRLSTGVYAVQGDLTIEPDSSGNALQVEPGARVMILFMGAESKLTVTGRDADADPEGVGRAAILLPVGSALTICTDSRGNSGTLNATGGKAGNGADGGDAGLGAIEESPSTYARTGNGGDGGTGGGGAGAAIGTDGGKGGAGGAGGAGVSAGNGNKANVYGNDGKPGSVGAASKLAGTVIIWGPNVAVNATGGVAGKGGKGGERGDYRTGREFSYANSTGTSAGGGGGGGGTAADGIGSGGTGGGGGGGGASGSIDGEPALFGGADLDNLWGHSGAAGASTRGGTGGGAGREGANGGDDTDTSRKYAKSGGSGGSCTEPEPDIFFFDIRVSAAEQPSGKVVSGDGRVETARRFVGDMRPSNYGEYSVNFHWGVKVVYDEKAHGVKPGGSGGMSAQSAGPAALRAQAEGADEEWPSSGTAVVDGVEVTYSIYYYDEATGEELGSAPVKPGHYAAVVFLTDCRDVETGEALPDDIVVAPIEISKIEVEKPAPKPLTFECADWETGEGAVQDAFGDLASDDYVFDATASKEVGGKTVFSIRSASDAGVYEACFRLKDPETHAWAGESENAEEVWVPWSIALQELDPNDLTYWGTAHDKAATKVTYTGEPVWVRPWFTPAKEAGGELPEWLTHWGKGGLPAGAGSAAVVYVRGEGDEQGLVGYHEGADGALEPVTAAQVFAWANGVDIDGEHVAVESGEKVWYKTGEGGWWVPLAVGEGEPAGAEGSIVARDWSYVDKLGVMDAGAYTAYALFDEGAGFAPTALASAAVTVAKAGQSISAKGSVKATAKAKASGKKRALARKATVDLAKKARVSAETKVAYAKANKAGGKRIAVAKKTGKVTLKKGLKKGTYKVKVRLTAPEGANYEAAKARTVTLTVRVK